MITCRAVKPILLLLDGAYVMTLKALAKDAVRRAVTLRAIAVVIGLSIGQASTANPQTSLLTPDVFGTETALRARVGGFNDPLGRLCELPSGPLSFAAAVDLALCRNPATRAAWASAREQAAALGVAQSAWLPTVEVTGVNNSVSGQHVDATSHWVDVTQRSRDAAVNLSLTLYDFGGRESRIQLAHHVLDAAALTANSVAQQTVLAVVQSYYGAVAADDALAAAQHTESVYAHSLEVAKSLQTGGVASLADVLQVETAHGEAAVNRIQASAVAKAAHGALAVTLGLSADQGLRLEKAMVPVTPPVFTALMADLMAEAARQRPDLAAAQAARDAAMAEVTVARAVGRPRISFGTSHSTVDTTGLTKQNYNTVGFSVTVPIFNGFSTAYGVRQAQAAVEASEANVEQARLTVSLGVWNAYYGLTAANEGLVATASLSKAAASNEEVALGRYQSGVGSILDVLTAETGAATGRQLRINAERDWHLARAQLALALGRLTGAAPLSLSAQP